MTMTIEQAKQLIGELVGNFDSDGQHMEAWDTVLAHIEGRVVTDEMESRAAKALLDSASSHRVAKMDGSSDISFHFNIRAALQAALGVGK